MPQKRCSCLPCPISRRTISHLLPLGIMLHTGVLQEDAAKAPVNILLTYSVKQERSPRIESLPPGCTPAKLAGLLQTGLFGSPAQYGLKMLVSPATVQFAMLQHDSVVRACCMLGSECKASLASACSVSVPLIAASNTKCRHASDLPSQLPQLLCTPQNLTANLPPLPAVGEPSRGGLRQHCSLGAWRPGGGLGGRSPSRAGPIAQAGAARATSGGCCGAAGQRADAGAQPHCSGHAHRQLGESVAGPTAARVASVAQPQPPCCDCRVMA